MLKKTTNKKQTVAGDGTFNKCKTILVTLPKVIRTHTVVNPKKVCQADALYKCQSTAKHQVFLGFFLYRPY